MLRSTLIDLIENRGAELFYVGNQGGFDAMVTRVLRELMSRYPIRAYTVLAYLPVGENIMSEDLLPTILPEGIETVPRRFAISFRNRWMIAKSDFVVTHVTNHIASGAAQFKALAEKQGKTVINLTV
ncbi:MAG: hypothetical protein IKG85_06265 [Clostridia bacterium]|nr:hypothetical protein [Clostridia bacterium]